MSYSDVFDYSRCSIPHTYDASTRTLTIHKSGGYTSALAASLPLHETTILHDRSNTSTPTSFPLPALEQAHFTGTAIPPPNFPLPTGCKIYACLGRTAPWDEGEDSNDAPGTLDTASPWLRLPGLEVLRCSMMSTPTTPPPPSEVKHLLISEGECFLAPLPQKLETFAMEYDGFRDTEEYGDRRKIDVCALVKGLPQDTLRILALGVYDFDLPEQFDTTPPDLRGFKALRTLCVPWYLLPEEMAEGVPEGVENLAVELWDWNYKSDVGEQVKGFVERCKKLRRLLVQGWEDMGVDAGELRRVCEEKGVVLTMSGGRATYYWPQEETDDAHPPQETDAPYLYWDEENEEDLNVIFMFRKEPF